MTFSDFKKKNLDKQLKFVLEKGKLVNGVTNKKHYYRLFNMGTFYAEVKNDPNNKKLIEFKPIEKNRDLKKYVENFADIYEIIHQPK